ncbi:formate-dependent phosphoribosylglycinamide formyltransferase [Methanimicrococcus blatticola]|uniref:Formate-dependent phosphoribosylglycinamide formyltransferase n=1 Tax=Methanimicrococcus blatticola TaxID=91560 RepID=A0A484F4Z6_9EURY|nr:formate-dependent phosphoribosylglycinamide formyltransferase [Methanimicrococcus blatticola]MBZ3935931.1 formate-dependent phosphoribosylglycinamide formyltransferase [Methanimicrococcus blatticola]MCC2509456.1 formate-dependent phosphoribosylglycinamide formyltransferase [Methanimicrococcus blatticola]TDQ68335.1 formate-dependent phosphoribosylglycinamide formyltransferase [Methanimicrococcus blatticola]
MVTIGTPLSENATKVLLCGSGELGKEVAIELQRLGVEVVALDRYENAPAMQVAHRSYVLQMTDGAALREIIEKEMPDFIVPEIEAIATDTLAEIEKTGIRGKKIKVVPSAKAVQLTMNREGIRRLAAEKLKLKTSAYYFAESEEEVQNAAKKLGFPCLIKPIMSSSGKGQSVIRSASQIKDAFDKSQREARGSSSGDGSGDGSGNSNGNSKPMKVIVEEFIEFDYEITLLTVQSVSGTIFCEPIGHVQINGDYRESWQPQKMDPVALKRARNIAGKITKALGGYGIFGVELFVKGKTVYFNEVSPRPHDTGMVTMISQDLSEFALHTRAFLELPIPAETVKGKKGKKSGFKVVKLNGPAASKAIFRTGTSNKISYSGLEKALEEKETQIRLFGKPEIKGERRLGVALAKGKSVKEARKNARKVDKAVCINLNGVDYD